MNIMIRSPGSNTSLLLLLVLLLVVVVVLSSLLLLLMLVLLDNDKVSFKACNIKAFLVCVSRLVVSLSRKVVVVVAFVGDEFAAAAVECWLTTVAAAVVGVVELFVMGDARGVEEEDDDDVPVTPAAPRVGEVNVEEEEVVVVATAFFMGDIDFG
jgi:hypothetical protein